jgi:hypothetical protein
MQPAAQERVRKVVPVRDRIELAADEPSFLGRADKRVAEGDLLRSGVNAVLVAVIATVTHGVPRIATQFILHSTLVSRPLSEFSAARLSADTFRIERLPDKTLSTQKAAVWPWPRK